MCYCSSHHGLLVTLCFSHLLPGISHPCAGTLLPHKDHQKLLIWFKSICKLFDLGDIAVKGSPEWIHPCVLGFKRGRAVGLVAVWRSSFHEGLQDLSTLASPGATGWSWPVPSTAPRKRCDSHSATGCYGDAVSSALRDKFQWNNTVTPCLCLKMGQHEGWESYLAYEQTCFRPLPSGGSHWEPAEKAWPCCWTRLEAGAPARCSSSTVPRWIDGSIRDIQLVSRHFFFFFIKIQWLGRT